MGAMDSHPKQSLVFFFTDNCDDFTIHSLEKLLLEMRGAHPWAIEPPEFVDEPETDDVNADGPQRLLGGILQIYSAFPPWRDKLPRELDVQNFRDCEFLVKELETFSDRHGVSFDFELGETFVGSISDGHADRLLSVGLLGEWKRTLGL